MTSTDSDVASRQCSLEGETIRSTSFGLRYDLPVEKTLKSRLKHEMLQKRFIGPFILSTSNA